MLDLGDQAETLHYAVGVMLAKNAIDHTLAFGEWSEAVAAGFRSVGGSSSRISVFENRATLDAMLDCIAAPGDTVLVKGSRDMHMETVLDSLHRRLTATVPSMPVRRAA